MFVRLLQDGQNYLLAPGNSSDSWNVSMDSGTNEVKATVIISNFSSSVLQQRQMSEVSDVWRVDEMILSAAWDKPLNSSITIC